MAAIVLLGVWADAAEPISIPATAKQAGVGQKGSCVAILSVESKLFHSNVVRVHSLAAAGIEDVQADRVRAEEAALGPVLDGYAFHPARIALLVTLEKAEVSALPQSDRPVHWRGREPDGRLPLRRTVGVDARVVSKR